MEPKKPQRPSASKPRPAKKPQSTTEYVFGWLGRQVGHVKKAVKADVTKSAKAPKPAAKKPSPKPPASASPPATSGVVVYRQNKVEEAEMPDQPGVILRRTIIDEVVVERDEKK